MIHPIERKEENSDDAFRNCEEENDLTETCDKNGEKR